MCRTCMIRLSKHIIDEMGKPGISIGFIERTIILPDRIAPAPVQPGLSRSFKAMSEFGARVLRVMHRPDNGHISVVTAHWDKGAARS